MGTNDTSTNNSTGNSTIDGLMDYLNGGGNNSQPVVPSATPAQGIQQNPMDVLRGLVGGGMQAAGQGLQGLGNMVNPQQSPAMQQAMTKAATKQVQSWADNHAQNSDPMTLAKYLDNQPQPGQGGDTPMSGGQTMPQLTPQQQQAMQGINGATQQNSQPQVAQQPVQQNNSSQNQNTGMTDQIQEQAQKLALQKPGILGSIFNTAFNRHIEGKLENLELAQKITQGGPPLSPTEKATAIGNWNSALLQQHKDFQSDLSDQIKANTDAQSAYIKNTPLPTKASDWPAYTKKLQEYSTNTSDLTSRMIEGFNKYRNLQLTNPVTGQKGNKSYAAGDTVTYGGKQRIIKSINEKTGTAILQ